MPGPGDAELTHDGALVRVLLGRASNGHKIEVINVYSVGGIGLVIGTFLTLTA